MDHNCSCGEEFEWESDWDFEDVVCPKCGTVYEIQYDENYDSETGDEFQIWWLEKKEEEEVRS